jgi:hypothetical protein
MNAYLAATQGGAFKPSKTTQDFSKDIQNEYPFTQVKSPFFSEAFDLNKMLSTESPVGVSADSPLGRSDAQNSAQRGDTYSEALKAAQEDIQKPQKFDPFVVAQQDIQGARERSAGLANMTGFNREVGRDYEPVTQSDEIVGMKAKRKSNEDITQQELDRKSWVSPEYLKATESGSVFTPRLDKFKAMQDPAAMVHSWDRPESAYAGKTNTEMRQIAKDLRGGESNVGRVLGAQTMTTGSGVQTRYTPANITSSQDAVRKASEATVVTERVVGPDGKEMVKMKGTSSAPLQKRTDQVGPEPDEET